jgi:hypothetical protein
MFHKLTRAAGLLAAITVLILLPAVPAFAHVAGTPLSVPDTSGLTHVIDNLRAWIMGILAAIATLYLTIGGVRYLTAGGDPTEIDKAKSAFKSAGVGYALAVLAPVLLIMLQSILA